jgi:hypothetical protein
MMMICRLCGKEYQHPDDCIAGVGKCGDCFWQLVQWEDDMARTAENLQRCGGLLPAQRATISDSI